VVGSVVVSGAVVVLNMWFFVDEFVAGGLGSNWWDSGSD